MLLLDITVVNVALPDIAKDLHSSFSELQWVVDAYALGLASFLLTTGTLADRFGHRRIFVYGLVGFTSASILCGISPSSTLLIFARGLQGIGGAAMFATSLSLIASAFSGPDRGTAFGIWGATIGAAVAIGRWSAACSRSRSAGSRSSSSTSRSGSPASRSPWPRSTSSARRRRNRWTCPGW